MLRELHLDTFIDRLEQSEYGMDEVFTSTLNSNLPDFPGGYTWRCLENGTQQEMITRFFFILMIKLIFQFQVCHLGHAMAWTLPKWIFSARCVRDGPRGFAPFAALEILHVREQNVARIW